MRLTIKAKLAGAFTLLVVLTGIMGAIAIEISQHDRAAVHDALVSVEHVPDTDTCTRSAGVGSERLEVVAQLGSGRACGLNDGPVESIRLSSLVVVPQGST